MRSAGRHADDVDAGDELLGLDKRPVAEQDLSVADTAQDTGELPGADGVTTCLLSRDNNNTSSGRTVLVMRR
jgi:hypothetical protein